MKRRHKKSDVRKSRVLPGIEQSCLKPNLRKTSRVKIETTNVEKIK